MSSHPTMQAAASVFNRESGRSVASAHEIRRTIGRAWLAIAASGERIRLALSIHHSQVSYRKGGAGAVANAAIELAALERNGICANPLLDALKMVVLKARGWTGCFVSRLVSCVSADTREDLARAEFQAGLPGARERYVAALLEQARESEETAQALLAGGGR
jgi:hypothetical protein